MRAFNIPLVVAGAALAAACGSSLPTPSDRADGATGGSNDAMGLGGKDEVGVGSMGIYIIALDPSNGNPIWHARIGQVTNAPETYLVDGHQFILVAAGDMLYAFTLH